MGDGCAFSDRTQGRKEPRPVPVLRAASRPSGLSGPSLWWSWSYEIQLDQRANECTAYSKLTGDNKELLIIPGANHTDLYDQMEIIPFEKLNAFFTEYLR